MKIETREQLADELLRGCPEDSLRAHQKIAQRILLGANMSQVITDDEAEHYPDTYAWLRSFVSILGE